MKVLVVLAFVATAAAWPNLGFQADAADVSDAQKQHDINFLLHKIYGEIRDPNLKGKADSFDPEADLSHYSDNGEAVHKLIRDLKDHRLLEQNHWFSLFNPRQRHEALMLFDVLIRCKDWDTFVSNAAYFRQRMNEGEFVYALYVAVIHSPLAEHVVLPPLYEVTPHLFTNSEVIEAAYRAKQTQTPGKFQSSFTGTKKNPEQRVAYFGEDIGMNTHHVTWHMEFPFWWQDEYSHHLDRKGENFFWVHHQLTVRFDAERLSNYLDPVGELHWGKPIVQGFAPHTTYKYGGQFPSRPDNVDFEDVDGVARIRDLLIVESRIRDAIAHGYIVDKQGNRIDIMNERGIDILGDIIESSMYSPNVQYYGALHNTAHIVLGRQADPHGKYALPPGVLEHFETATRDPSFFRLHKYMDNIFKEHKDSLPPYSKEELTFTGVNVENLSVDGELETFFEDYEYSLINAVDDTEEIADVEISTYVPRLNHKDFAYNIEVTNNNGKEVLTTVRIFAWPHRDNNGIEYTFDEGRWNAIELDKFWVKLSPGSNHIVRKSSESAVTVPDVPSFDTLFKKAEAALGGGDAGLTEFESATGIPNRFLLPKGNEQGLEFDLVVAVTDGEADAAVEGLHDNTDFIHYGSHGKYPDNRPHGYPLDRKVPDDRVFEDLPNFKHIQVKVFNHGEHIHHH
ncbi:hemocyanin subunit-like [Penaeus chinensis]|uniref:hemocyanin subunit-like n=1 Tax=Penaeus chinensis TaxID=139456 RepID=UPI001FB6BCBB|nr:hemocyanin subunit-like isoform X2 [Penaeus chinensis]XP_047499936.1 hemocyanin subunit-like [Penaeus chinensis]XP_047499942.1 hemocyanin subunit-like [Penaeus chinensis]